MNLSSVAPRSQYAYRESLAAARLGMRVHVATPANTIRTQLSHEGADTLPSANVLITRLERSHNEPTCLPFVFPSSRLMA